MLMMTYLTTLLPHALIAVVAITGKENAANGVRLNGYAHAVTPSQTKWGCKAMSKKLTSYEQETIINFNKAENVAHIFTYEKTWQQHLEKRLGLKPSMNNGFGGKEYEIDKKRIRPPRVPVRLSAEARARLTNRMKGMSKRRSLRSKTTVVYVVFKNGTVPELMDTQGTLSCCLAALL